MGAPSFWTSMTVAVALLLGCESRCELDPELRELAGSGATSCGRVPLGGDQSAAHRCAVESLRAGRAFWVQWQRQGIDSEVWAGLARAPDGTGYSYFWDGDPSGGSNAGATAHRSRCARLEVATVDGLEQVVCEGGGPLETVCGR